MCEISPPHKGGSEHVLNTNLVPIFVSFFIPMSLNEELFDWNLVNYLFNPKFMPDTLIYRVSWIKDEYTLFFIYSYNSKQFSFLLLYSFYYFSVRI